jgi:glucose/arabinose dehydrogenase
MAVAPALGALLALALLVPAAARADAPEVVLDGFHGVPLATGLSDPTAARFSSDGRMWVAEKWGPVLVYDEPLDPTPTEVVNLQGEVNSYWDRGLLGMALDPDLDADGGHIYLLYSRDAPLGENAPYWNDNCPAAQQEAGCAISARLVKLTVDAGGKAVGQPQVLVDQQWCAQFPSHSIGTVALGPDGMLYVGAGDGASFVTADWGQLGGNPCGDPANQGGALRSQDYRLGSDPVGYDGSILRVDPQTGASRTVVAYGLRNPFRFSFKPNTSEIWLGDVGWDAWEEINRFDTGGAVENFGWPCYEGTAPSGNAAYTGLAGCSSLQPGSVTLPFYAYQHYAQAVPGDGCGTGQDGSAVSGIAFYTGTAYPAAYRGAMFFSDASRNCIWMMRAGPNGDPDPSTATVVARGVPGMGGPVDLQVGPGGDIVYSYLGAGGGQIRRIHYSPLQAKLTASPTSGASPLDVAFSAAGSTGEGLSYEWDLDDGTGFHAGGPTLSHTFTGRRNFNVRVRVTDTYGEQDVASVLISAGNQRPSVPSIAADTPARGWAVGDPLHFSGVAADPDGDALTYEWKLTIRHCQAGGGCHGHDVSTTTGTTADFVAPDHSYPSLLWITLTVRDGLGLTAEKRIELAPRTVTLTARATPAPLTVALNGAAATTARQTVIAGSRATLTTAWSQVAGGQTYRFMGWSDGDMRLTRTLAVRASTTLTARFLSPPGPRTPPTISGTTRTRHTLTARVGGWLGNELSYGYQWLRCASSCAPIAGSTAATYRVRDADLGRRLAVRVTARNQLGSATQESRETGAIVEGVPPKLRLTVPERIELGNGRLRIKVRCTTERCSLRANGLLRIQDRRSTKTKTVTRTLGKGKRATLTVRLSARQRRAAERALRTGRSVSVRFSVSAADKLSNRHTEQASAKLRR